MRLAVSGVALALIVGCAHTPPPPPKPPQFASDEQKISACLDLRDHITDIYARTYVTTQGMSMSPEDYQAFRQGWAEELVKKGTFDRFEQTCFAGLTPKKFECGMGALTTDAISACMKFW